MHMQAKSHLQIKGSEQQKTAEPKVTTKIKCYVLHNSKLRKKKICMECGEQLVQEPHQGLKMNKQLIGKVCNKCRILYISYYRFSEQEDMWDPINKEQLPQIKERVERANINRQKRNQNAVISRRKREEENEKPENSVKKEPIREKQIETGFISEFEMAQIRYRKEKQGKKECISPEIKKAAEMEKNKRLEEEAKERNRMLQQLLPSSSYNHINNKTTVQKPDKPGDSKKGKQVKKKDVNGITLITGQDVIVRNDIFKCQHNKHGLEDIDAYITTVSNRGTVNTLCIPAGYCPVCGMYFIMESTYQRIKKIGVPLCKYISKKPAVGYRKDKEYDDYYFDYRKLDLNNLAPESILKRYGYDVSQETDLSSVERRNILSALIDYEVLTKSEIISYIDFFINLRKGKKSIYSSKYANAVSKWESDRRYIQDYKIGTIREIKIQTIIRNK